MKTCTGCGESKPVTEYTKHKLGRDGLRPRCKSCVAVEATAYREANREKIRAHNRKMSLIWNVKHRDKRRAQCRSWRLRNVERRKAYMVEWRRQNYDLVLAALHRRERRLKGAAGHGYTAAKHIRARVDFYGGRCVYCGEPWQCIDHRIPISRGGSHWPANLVPACTACNLRKRTKTVSEFKAELAA